MKTKAWAPWRFGLAWVLLLLPALPAMAVEKPPTALPPPGDAWVAVMIAMVLMVCAIAAGLMRSKRSHQD